MNTAFLLRFQEECVPDDSPRIRAADPTVTKIAAEQPDVDGLTSDHRTFVSPSRPAADPTKTAIKAEAPDEAADSGMTAMPRPLSLLGPTGTSTAIKAEADDTDFGQGSIHVLPVRDFP